MFMTFGEGVSQGLKIEQPYFQTVQPLTWQSETSYTQDVAAPRIESTINHQWNHALAEIVTALLEAGLVIDEFEKLPTRRGALGQN